MKKFMVSITIVMAMIVTMFGFGPEKAFAAQLNEERAAYTEIDKVDEQMELIDVWFDDLCKTYDIKVISSDYYIYEDVVIWHVSAIENGDVIADSIVYTFDEVNQAYNYANSWLDAAKFTDWQ